MARRKNNKAEVNLKKISGKAGHIFLSGRKKLIPPNIGYVNLDKIRLDIATAYTIEFNNDAEYREFLRRLSTNRLLFSKAYKNSFEFNDSRLLFSGTLTVFKPPWQARGMSSFCAGIKLELYLNLTRAANHAACYSGHDVPFMHYVRNTPPEGVLLKARAASASLTGLGGSNAHRIPEPLVGLDDEDNIMEIETLFNLRPVRHALPLYLEAVLENIRDGVETAVTGVNSDLSVSEEMSGYVIKDMECYWEYISPDALSVVKAMGELAYLFNDAKIATYISGSKKGKRIRRPVTPGHTRNCPSLTFGLREREIDLVIYAKLLDRVRFEVRYKGNLNQILRIEKDNNLRAGVAELLDESIRRSHDILSRFFERLPPDCIPKKMYVPRFVSLLSGIAKAAAPQTRSRANVQIGTFEKIFPILATMGSVQVKTGTMEHRACLALQKQEILYRVETVRQENNYPRFALHAEYRKVLKDMLGTLAARTKARPRRRRN